jgi:hypothetical protein
VLADIKKRKLEWLGHVSKMDRKREIKNNFENRTEGRIKMAKSRLIWLKRKEIDLQVDSKGF